METTSIFLGSKGLSQSEANHTANVAKEIAETFGSEIHNMSLFKKTLNDKYGKTAYNHVRVVEGLEEKCLATPRRDAARKRRGSPGAKSRR